MVLPEGTRTRDGKLGPFKKGGFRLALETGLDILPESREKSLAYTALEESLMWANAAIARNEITGVEVTVTDENNVTINVDASE